MREFTHQLQPSPRTCGQTVLAMLLGCDPVEVIAELGDEPTSAKTLIAYLRRRGWITDPRAVRVRDVVKLPPLCIVRVIWNERRHRTHWMLWVDGRPLDPVEHPSRWVDRGGRIMSRIAVVPA
jgi:hypothetical protein